MNLDEKYASLFNFLGENTGKYSNDGVLLHYKSVADVGGLTEDMSVILLLNEDESRQVLIPCDIKIKQEILLRFECTTPETQDMLIKRIPEVLGHMLGLDGKDCDSYINIKKVVDGEYDVRIQSKSAPKTDEGLPIRASDGILLAVIFGLEIRMDSSCFRYQSAPYEGIAERMPMPINVMSDANLEEALRKSVDIENYEVASAIRDELKRRREKRHNIHTNNQ